ncbi:NADP-dependent oxidoreductase [Pedobacter gandavensis]|uniref:Zinc-binding dehydrogenase n=1 Tax=Pedobacter gandavensis TaxID=2679963 RepID=A0ABR6ETY6_9SPHI|nr:NADP-dependent oxidoreductase [Pedobacter gandavensis]MBB2148661.1 zinc-binding dehydrogenase [Pedobacter gandavensis]
MKAIILKEFGSADELQIQEIQPPVIKEAEVLVRVKAISINPVDIKTREGKGVYGKIKDEKPMILGWDISGIVQESRSEKFKVGDEVFGMVNFPGHGKGYAEYVAAPASQLALKPSQVSHTDAAAATLAALTAWQVLVDHMKIKAGDRVLIHAAAGGVGHYAVQIAKNLGAYVIGTSSAAKKDFIMSLGADEHIDYTAGPLEQFTNNIDFVLDTIGGDNIDHSLKVMKKGGTIISIPSGLREEVTEKAKAMGIHGYFTMVQSDDHHIPHIAELLKNGKLKSHVSQIFNFDQMAEAHKALETGRTQGKIVLTVNV